jgi:hypothetical protein
MGKKGSKRTKKAPVLFPEEHGVSTPIDIQLGHVLRVSRPSNRYYQYIFTSLDFLNQKLSDLKELLQLEGTLVKVTGVIQLKDGNKFAIVQHQEGKTFFNREQRLFIDAFKALENREIIIER